MIGYLYRYIDPIDASKTLYVGQGKNRDKDHRSERTSFGKRFKKKFPNLNLPIPIKWELEVSNQMELNEEETIAMFRFHSWWGYEGGMNLSFPNTIDYIRIGQISAELARKNNIGLFSWSSETKSRYGKIGGAKGGRATKESTNGRKSRGGIIGGSKGGHRRIELYGNPRTTEGSIKGGTTMGRRNAEKFGYMQAIGKIGVLSRRGAAICRALNLPFLDNGC